MGTGEVAILMLLAAVVGAVLGIRYVSGHDRRCRDCALDTVRDLCGRHGLRHADLAPGPEDRTPPPAPRAA